MGVAVLRSGAGDREVGGRLTPIISSEGHPLVLREQDTILELQKP
jgi:hypothetical protein